MKNTIMMTESLIPANLKSDDEIDIQPAARTETTPTIINEKWI